MNTFNWYTRLAIGICLVQLFSCQKQLNAPEDSLHFETSSDAAVANEFNNCRLRTITHGYSGAPGDGVTGTFTYHPDGLPFSLTYGSQTGTGNPNYYFFYDGKRRLKEFRIGYTPDDIVEAEWHKYGYNSADQIIADTVYSPGAPHDGIPAKVFRASQITYDNQGRVISETIKNFALGSSQTINYSYDSRGNLVVNGWPSSSYDNLVSIFRAHPVFQFLHRNYSRNNAAAQAKYNFKGLPASNNPSNDAFFNAYPTNTGGSGISKATYDCDVQMPANEFLNCRLRYIVHEHGGVPGLPVTGTFTYHPDGLPFSLTYGSQTGTGNPNYYFMYDGKRRLREFRIGYSPDDIVEAEWHKYGYNNANQIIVDTNYTSGAPYDGIPAKVFSVSQITYDNQGRVISETIKNLENGSSRTINYSYDSRGNLVVNGWPSSSYDNYVSIFRTHPVFQFIHRNYSRNNAAPQAKYNSKGLPLSNNPANDGFFNTYPNNIGGTGVTRALYDCQ